MGTKKETLIKVLIILACVVSLVVFLLETFCGVDFLSSKLLQTYDKNGQHKIIFLDVADGNAAIIQSGEEVAIINFGGIEDGGNAITKALHRYRITKVDYAVITIADEFHLGGFMAVAEMVNINKVITPNLSDFDCENSITATTMKNQIITNHNYEIAKLNNEFKVGEFTITPIYYNSKAISTGGKAVLYKITAFNKSAIIGGNFDNDIMYQILSTKQKIKCDLFLLPGFSDSTNVNLPFIKSINAKYLVSSSGYKNNSNTQDAFNYLNSNYKLYRTDTNGDIAFYFNSEGLSVKPSK